MCGAPRIACEAGLQGFVLRERPSWPGYLLGYVEERPNWLGYLWLPKSRSFGYLRERPSRPCYLGYLHFWGLYYILYICFLFNM